MDPRDTLKLAETESTLWADAHVLTETRIGSHAEVTTLPSIPGRWCFTDGSWKENEVFSGQGWLSTLEGFDELLGAKNVRACLSPLHAEIEALLWAMECMKNLRQFQVTFATDCSQLVKMVSEPEEWPTFASYLEDIKSLKEVFTRSDIIYVPRTQNSRADSLARSARNNCRLSFTWIKIYRSGSQSQYESVFDDKKKKDKANPNYYVSQTKTKKPHKKY